MSERGFTLVEVMVALVLVTVLMLSVAQLMAVGVYVNKAAGDVTQATALAGEKIEELKYLPFNNITAGGDLNNDVNGFFDQPDVEGDGRIDYTRRWEVTELAYSKEIEVRVIGQIDASGPVKETTVGIVVARR